MAGTVSLLINGIGELVTNDPTLGDGAARAAPRRRAASSRTAGSPGSGRPRDAPAADRRLDAGGRRRAARLRRQPRPPGLRRRPGRRVRRPDGRRSRTPAAASAPRSRATRAATDDELRATVARLRRRGAAAGHHHHRDQERVRAHRRRRGPLAADRRASSPTRPRSSARTWCRPSTPTDPTTTSTWSAGRCWPPPRRTPAGSTCSASGAPSTPTRPARCSPPGSAAGLAPRVHANQLGPGPGVQLGGGAGRGQRRPLHPPDRRRRGRAGRLGARWPPCCPARSSPPGRRTRTPAGCSTPGSPWRWPPTATPARRTPRRCRSASRSPCARCG